MHLTAPQPSIAYPASPYSVGGRDAAQAALFARGRELFQLLDVNKDGYVDRAEFRAAIYHGRFDLSRAEVERLHAEMDINKDGVVSESEFIFHWSAIVQGRPHQQY